MRRAERNAEIERLAFEYADSGNFDGYQAIEHQLCFDGYPEARGLLDGRFIRFELDQRCAAARMSDKT